jgi:hypothetical protein
MHQQIGSISEHYRNVRWNIDVLMGYEKCLTKVMQITGFHHHHSTANVLIT